MYAQCFIEQHTEIQESIDTLSKESVTQIIEVQETSVEYGDVKGDDHEAMVPSRIEG